MSDLPPLEPFAENRRGPARLPDREFIQLLVDLGDLDLPIEPTTPLTEWETAFILERYHEAHPSHRPCRLAPVAG